MVTSPIIILITILAAALAEPWQPVTMPAPGVWHRARLAESTPADARLVMRGYAGELEVFAGSQRIYAFKNEHAAGRLTIHVIELPHDARELFLRVPATARPPFIAGSRVVAKAELPLALVALVAEPIGAEMDDLITGALIGSFGLLAMLFSAVRRRGDAKTLVYFGAFSFLYGARLIVESTLLPLAGVPLETMQRIQWAITYVITIPGWALADRLIGAGWKSTLRMQVWAFAAFAPIGIVSDFVQDRAGSLEEVNNVLVIIGGINILLNLIHVRRRRETWVVLAGSVLFMTSALLNNLASLGMLPMRDFDETPGFLAFFAALGYAAARRFARTEREQTELEGELAAAREIQRSILPASMPRIEGLAVEARFVPASTVAGDLYDFLELGQRRGGVFVADVSGHGIPAALVASMVKVAVSSQARFADDPAALLRELNAILARDVRRGFVTATYLFFDGLSVQVANAGHPAPLLLRKGEVRELGAVNPLLGRFKSASYSAATTELQPGDRIVAYTDGVTEALNARGEAFGEARLYALLREGADVIERVLAWRGGGRDADDLTLVTIDVR